MSAVKVYSTDYCPYCRAAESLLKAKGVPFDLIDVSNDDAMREELVKLTGGRRTVPQIFVNEQSIGGFTELRSLVSSGQFDEMLAAGSS